MKTVKQMLGARAAKRLRARRVRRLVRHVEPWSVLKLSLVLYICFWAVLLFVGVTLWQVAVNTGLVANIETFVTELGALESFKIHGDQIFQIAVAGGLLLVVALTGLTVLGSVLFNLISDVTGGVRFTVVEEETARPRARRTQARRTQAPRPRAPRPRRVKRVRGKKPQKRARRVVITGQQPSLHDPAGPGPAPTGQQTSREVAQPEVPANSTG